MFTETMSNETKQKIIARKHRIIAELKKEIDNNGYAENLGQKEARQFNDWLGSLMTKDEITYAEMAKYSGQIHEAVHNL